MQRLISSLSVMLCLLATGPLALASGGPGRVPAASWSHSRQAAHFAGTPALAGRYGLFGDVEAEMAAARPDQPLEVVIRYKPGREPARIAGAQRGDYQRRLALDHSIATRLTRQELRRLIASGAVESVEADEAVHATRDTAESSFGVTRARTDFGLNGDGDGDPNSFSPRDHTIAIIDTGIDGSHRDFAGGKIIFWKDFVNDKPQPYDDGGHGTHVASIAAGEVNAAGVGGVAPGAALIGLKVLDSQGGGVSSRTAQAVEWCITNKAKYGIEVINMSLGGSRSSDGTDLLSRTVNRAVAAGIVVCVAAGNEGPAAYTISSPAAAADAIAVGNMVDWGKGGFALWLSSSHGPTADGRIKPDLCGPGYKIVAAQANSGDGYTTKTGTSMASPFVAGVAALMRQANPDLAPKQITAIMKQTAVHWGYEGENNDFGAGRLDGFAALAQAAGKRGDGPQVPNHLHGDGTLEGADDTEKWDLQITDTHLPVAATLIMDDETQAFTMTLYDPSGRQVATSAGKGRIQLLALGLPKQTGTFTLEVHSTKGGGDYSLDVSAAAEPTDLE